jgi:hypothetical protein
MIEHIVGIAALWTIWMLTKKFHRWIDRLEESHRESTKYEVPDVIPEKRARIEKAF